VLTNAVLTVVHPPLLHALTLRRTAVPARDEGLKTPVARTVLPSVADAVASLSVSLGLATVTIVRLVALVPVPPTVVTVIGPVVAPPGTMAVSRVPAVALNVVAEVPLKPTAKAPVNPVPVRVTTSPTAAEKGRKPAITGAGGSGRV
jgi:hypothetical protein